MKRLRAGGIGKSRGFTLVELLAAIVIIGLLATLATPSFIAMMRDRRVATAGVIVADLYREARTRSLARGNAVIVRWTPAAGGKGTLEMRETIILPGGVGVVRSCNNADWSVLSADTRAVRTVSFIGTTYELVDMKLVTEAGVDATFGETCFAPDGRTYVRYIANDAFAPLVGVPRYNIDNKNTGFKRQVFLPPNGVARMAL